ncbi:hypothetical protein [Burkholderia alba]|uniref:hypothetical protein n=1 Tax=Burkholderia alba TaxID=2683677 RepID=UPI002B051AC1|nr:hypothetical protein [Burkholderia alba]
MNMKEKARHRYAAGFNRSKGFASATDLVKKQNRAASEHAEQRKAHCGCQIHARS